MPNESRELLEWIEANGNIFRVADGWYAFHFTLWDLERFAAE